MQEWGKGYHREKKIERQIHRKRIEKDQVMQETKSDWHLIMISWRNTASDQEECSSLVIPFDSVCSLSLNNPFCSHLNYREGTDTESKPKNNEKSSSHLCIIRLESPPYHRLNPDSGFFRTSFSRTCRSERKTVNFCTTERIEFLISTVVQRDIVEDKIYSWISFTLVCMKLKAALLRMLCVLLFSSVWESERRASSPGTSCRNFHSRPFYLTDSTF